MKRIRSTSKVARRVTADVASSLSGECVPGAVYEQLLGPFQPVPGRGGKRCDPVAYWQKRALVAEKALENLLNATEGCREGCHHSVVAAEADIVLNRREPGGLPCVDADDSTA